MKSAKNGLTTRATTSYLRRVRVGSKKKRRPVIRAPLSGKKLCRLDCKDQCDPTAAACARCLRAASSSLVGRGRTTSTSARTMPTSSGRKNIRTPPSRVSWTMHRSSWVKGRTSTGVWNRVAEKDMGRLSGKLIYSFDVTIVQRNI